MEYTKMTREDLQKELDLCLKLYEEEKAKGLKLDLSRGKPSPAQLDLSNKVMDTLNSESVLKSLNGMDLRNYGGLDGIPEAKELFAEILDTQPENVFAGGNSSLTIEFDIIAHAMIDGLDGCEPWMNVKDRKWLCPAPGYDRHFNMTEHFGFELITVPMNNDGPDMDIIEELVANDPSIKGIWAVPKYQNPMGISFSDEVVRRFASMKTAAKDFRIFWDNAYVVHDLYADKQDKILEIISECEKAGYPNRVYEFTSTSKMAFPGSGIACVATSVDNMNDLKSCWTYAMIGPDKVNQMRQVLFFKNKENVEKHMQILADMLRPKFEKVLEVFDRDLDGLGIASYTRPLGGYFISFDAMEGCASKAVAMCKDAGVIFTNAGATFPYGKDPKDRNVRIAPSFATLEEIEEAASLFTLCVRIVSLKKLLA